MSNKRYSEEFKREAVKQVTERNYSVVEVSARLGISTKSLYAWINAASGSGRKAGELDDLRKENARLKSELKRIAEERDILKKAAIILGTKTPGNSAP